MAQHIVMADYNPLWPEMFEREAGYIKHILGKNGVAIYHIGSTAVPGLCAKPIIDIMPVVRSLAEVDAVSAAFEKMGYEYLGEFGIPGRRYLRKGGDERTHQVHIFTDRDTENINRHLAFRDYMRTHPEAREAYARLKTELAEKYPYDIDGYCNGKEKFVKQIERLAKQWQDQQCRQCLINQDGSADGPA